MKTFKQFYAEAYQLNEIDLKSIATGARSLLNPRFLVKGAVKGTVASGLKEPLKRATGNNPLLNKAIDVGADWVAPAVRWGPAARAVAPAIPLTVAGAAINKNIIIPAAMKTGSFRNEADVARHALTYRPYGDVPAPPGTYPAGGEAKPQRPTIPILNTNKPSGLLNRPKGTRNVTGQYD